MKSIFKKLILTFIILNTFIFNSATADILDYYMQSILPYILASHKPINNPPIANAGSDQSVTDTNTIHLNGSASTDPDNDSLTYSWTFSSKPIGSKAKLYNATAQKPTFYADKNGEYILKLVVNDGILDSLTMDTVKIQLTNQILFNFSIKNNSPSLSTYSTNICWEVVLSSDGAIAYVAEGRDGIEIFDISNPSSPILLSKFDTGGNTQSIILSKDGTKAYVSAGDSGLKIIDISNPSNPLLIGEYIYSINAYDILLSKDGTKAYIAGSTGLLILDIQNPSSPRYIGRYGSGLSKFYNMAISNDGKKVYVVNKNEYLIVLSVSNPSSPSYLKNMYTKGKPSSIVISSDDGIAYIATDLGLESINLNDSSLSQLDIFKTTRPVRSCNTVR